MTMAKRLLLVATVLMSMFSANAQDIHFTMFDMAPLTLNPANTGAYEGTFRLGGIYRNQWNAISDATGYQTPSAYIDAPLFRLFNKNSYSWLGAGVTFLNDQAGSAALSQNNAALSLAAHIPLTRTRKVYLSVGASGGFVQNRIDREALILRDQTDVTALVDNASYPDFGAGLLLNFILNRKLNFNFGFSAAHLLEPEAGFSASAANPVYKLPRRYIGHTTFNIDIAPRMTLTPMAFYQLQAGASELNLQALMGFHLNQQRSATFQAGLGYRMSDAAYARLGFLYKGFKVGAAYGFNLGGLANNAGRADAFELGLSYTAKLYPNKVLPTRILCPRF